MGGEEWLSSFFEEFLIGFEHTIEPWQQLLRAVIGVKDYGDAVGWCYLADVVCCRDSSSNGSLLVLVVDTLSRKVGSASLRELEDDGCLLRLSCFESGYGGRRAGDIDGRDGEGLLLGGFEELRTSAYLYRLVTARICRHIPSGHRRRK